MRMYIILTALLISSINLFAQDISCESENELTKTAEALSVPNCITQEKIDGFRNNLDASFCNECKGQFEKFEKIIPNKKNVQEDFFQASLDEYKKNLSNNLLSVVKMRILPNTGADFSKSIQSCQMRTAKDFSDGCVSPTAKLLFKDTNFFADLNKEISNDLAKFISREENFNPTPSILERQNPTCFIPEEKILSHSAQAYEKSFSKELVQVLQGLDFKKFSSTAEIFYSDEVYDLLGENAEELFSSLANHPLFSSHIQNPQRLQSFIKSIPAPFGHNELKKTLYSNKSGEDFDQELARSCDTSFKKLKAALCSVDFENGDISNDPQNNFAKLSVSKVTPKKENFTTSEEGLAANKRLLSLCFGTQNDKKLNLTDLNHEISHNMIPTLRGKSLKEFRNYKHQEEIGRLNTSLCKMTDKTCIEGTLTCSIYKEYKASLVDGSTESKLANSSNSEVNALLRSMIGDSSKIDPKTREILVVQGILPKEDGTIVKQPDIPERRPDFVSKPAPVTASAQVKAPMKASSAASNSQSERRPASNNESYNSNYVNPLGKSGSSNFEMPDFSDLMSGSDSELKEIQDEIRRRLMDLPEKRPSSVAQAKQIAKSSFEKSGKKMTPYQEARFAERLMQPQTTQEIPSESMDSNRASVSDTETQAEKWKNSQMDKALAGMAGAQQVANRDIASEGSSATASAPKELTKVALNIAEDPKVTLSELFSNKLHTNDSETQLLKVLMANKSNFLLQVKDASFKVVFDEKNNYNLLFESGNKQVAEKIRPQLEIFLKRLKK